MISDRWPLGLLDLLLRRGVTAMAMLRPSNAEAVRAVELLELVNAERTSRRVVSLKRIETLEKAAWEMIAEMRRSTYRKGHQDTRRRWPDERARIVGYRISPRVIVAENLAYNIQSPKAVFSTWMDNPEYHDNIVEEQFLATGIACRSGRWVQVLGSALDSKRDRLV